MTIPVRTSALVLFLVSWSSTIQASGIHDNCNKGEIPVAELVAKGLATPDDAVVRLPEFVTAGSTFLGYFGGQSESIGNDLYVYNLPPSEESTRAQKAVKLQDQLDLLNEIARIQTKPSGEITIPESLRRILNPQKVQEVLSPRLSYDWTTARAEPNLITDIKATPRDPLFAMQCGLKAIHAEMAWDKPPYALAPDVKVAIVDTGVADHRDLDAVRASGTDVDANGHGTHLAGIIGALKDDAKGIVGVTWKTNITAYRFTDAAGRGTLKDALRQITAALKAEPHIVVLAWGVGANSKILFDTLEKANTVLFVSAAGNDGNDTCIQPVFPAAYDLENLIAVMATTCDDGMARFSNFGAKTVDLAAPGEGPAKKLRILSTVLNLRWEMRQGHRCPRRSWREPRPWCYSLRFRKRSTRPNRSSVG